MLGWILLGIGILIILIVIGMYNSLIRLRNEVKNAFAQIDVQLKRRNDLIPNLVESVKGYMKHEKDTLENISKARSAIMNATSVDAKAKASNMMSETLKSLFAVAENYPKLRANENFIQLQEELTGTENKISYSRQFYNDSVLRYNTRIQTFPSTIFASMMNFTEELQFKASEEERKNVNVKF